MSIISNQRSADFIKISSQFKLGGLTTEGSHPVTADLSSVAQQDTAAGLQLLFAADADVFRRYDEFASSGRAAEINRVLVQTIRNGGRIFFTGCGSTGRLSILLDSIWRDFWQQQRANRIMEAHDYEDRTFSVMAGGDYALIKSVEGFEDFTAFGRKQMTDLAVSEKDVVFAITEGGETSFVIGTARAGVEAGAKVYFIYNNPDDVLCQTVERSREVIEDRRIEKINLTTGPMSITGSTRMQATSIQLAVMLTILEMTVRELLDIRSADVPEQFRRHLAELAVTLKEPEVLRSLAQIVELEETVYRSGHKNNYFASLFGIDVLTDTTERSPTYCTPPFRKFDDANASASWAFLYLPQTETEAAWRHILKRPARCVEWTEGEVDALVPVESRMRTKEIISKISARELMRFRIGLDGLSVRRAETGDSVVAVVSAWEKGALVNAGGFFRTQLETARGAGAKTGLIYFGPSEAILAHGPEIREIHPDLIAAFVPVPDTKLLLDGVTRLGVKLVMNAISTCTMVRLGRVMGNYMIWVVPSNLKLIDRATRYISRLAGLEYEAANALLFEVIAHIEPRMKADQAYPPVVGMAVLRVREHLTNAEAEARLSGAAAKSLTGS